MVAEKLVILLTIFMDFSSGLENETITTSQNIVEFDFEDRNGCRYTDGVFNPIRKNLSCSAVTSCSNCSLCCEDYQDHNLLKKELNFDLKLLCHSGKKLSLGWSLQDSNSSIIYVIELYENSTNFVSRANSTSNNTFTFSKLKESTKYFICISAFHKQRQLGKSECRFFLTRDKNFKSDVIKKAWLDNNMFVNKSALDGIIKWEPGNALVCDYEIAVFYGHDTFMQIEAEIPYQFYNVKLSDMDYNTNYSVKITSFSDQNESDEFRFSFVTPSCLSLHNNLTICTPPPPTHIEVKEEISKSNFGSFNEKNIFYDVLINWATPKLKPDFYIINVINMKTRIPLSTKNISGVETSVKIKKIALSKFYKVTMSAGSAGGVSVPTITNCEIEYPEKCNSLLWVILVPILSFILIFGLIGLIYQRREKIKLSNRRRQYFEELEQKAPKETDNGLNFTICNDNDPYEIISEKVLLFEILGEGAFGIVRKGWIPDFNKEVAVKMLKDDPSAEEVKQFRQEIDMMKSVGSHAHIVSLVGCCTCPSSTMMLIVEYCTQGDLQNYLRAAWDKISSKESSKPNTSNNTNSSNENNDLSNQIKYAELIDSENSENNSSSNINNFIVNKIYDLEQNIEEEKESNENDITPADLLSFARQIAMGMEFLSSNKVIHRDLAARNVLVCANKTVKIADFGLSRDIYQENMYRKRSSGKLPIKWMALESLTHQVYTTQSDVWSYGILLWEIVTLGGTPYPSIPTGRLVKLLSSGYRMECPSNCNLDIYNLMMMCWRTRPKDRPDFTEIRKNIDSLLEKTCKNSYLNLDILDYNVQNNIRHASSNDLRSNICDLQKNHENDETERYIQPITMTKNNLTSSMQLHNNYKTDFNPNINQIQTGNGLVLNNLNSLSHVTYPIRGKNIEEKSFYNKENGNLNNTETSKKLGHQAINFYVSGNDNFYPSQNIVLSTK